jgi:hypothetical protein
LLRPGTDIKTPFHVELQLQVNPGHWLQVPLLVSNPRRQIVTLKFKLPVVNQYLPVDFETSVCLPKSQRWTANRWSIREKHVLKS